MCKRCIDLTRQYLPGITDGEMHELLWGATAFPVADPEYLEGQLKEIAKRRADGGNCPDWLDIELAYADEVTTRAEEALEKKRATEDVS